MLGLEAQARCHCLILSASCCSCCLGFQTFMGVLDARLLSDLSLTAIPNFWCQQSLAMLGAQLTSPKPQASISIATWSLGHSPAHGTSPPGRCTPGAHAGPRSQNPRKPYLVLVLTKLLQPGMKFLRTGSSTHGYVRIHDMACASFFGLRA